MREQVAKFVRGCALCSTSKPSNRKLGLYMPLPVPSRPWESISMDYFIGGLPTTRKGHDYLFFVVDRFSKMCVLIPCKRMISGREAAELLFSHVWVHFGLPSSIISDRDSLFLGRFWKALWDRIISFSELLFHLLRPQYGPYPVQLPLLTGISTLILIPFYL